MDDWVVLQKLSLSEASWRGSAGVVSFGKPADEPRNNEKLVTFDYTGLVNGILVMACDKPFNPRVTTLT